MIFQTFGELDYMQENKWNKVVKRLWILWFITLLAVSIVSRIFSSYLYVIAGGNPNCITTVHFVFSIALAGLYFYPLLFIIKCFSARANMKNSVKAALCLIVFLSVWLVFSFIALIIRIL